MLARIRIDRLLVERGLFESRAKAQAAIAAGLVTADDVPVTRPSAEISPAAVIRAAPAFPWVSRGGVKLAHALDRLGLDPKGRVCLDVGAATGGFTEVLIARGARRVYAVDVGRDQLHARLRARPQVVSIESTDIRDLVPPDDVGWAKSPAVAGPGGHGARAILPTRKGHGARLCPPYVPKILDPRPDLVTIDVSFISLRLVLPAALALAAPRADLVALVKPQFEAGKRHLKKGIVRNPAVHEQVRADVAASLRALGCEVVAHFPSPIAGSDGNREFLIGARRG
jgi:23S rRNA (cytidine1920-2'-O)/16S rRNA (cytidine1409-2'-O)-methyltransferase